MKITIHNHLTKDGVDWKVTYYGWAAFVNGHRLSVKKYRRGVGKGFVYVARVDESALTSPAKAHETPESAKSEAEVTALKLPTKRV